MAISDSIRPAAARLRAALLPALGGGLGIALIVLTGALVTGQWTTAALLVAPMGASAVLVFAVPASPLAQPWPVIGGNLVAALWGMAVAAFVPPAPAAGLAVGGAILLMGLLRCLHPPGGATALVAIIGAPAAAAGTGAGFAYPLVPVAVGTVVLVLAGLAFHRISGHRWPHRAAPVPPAAGDPDVPHRRDVDRALAEMGETFDIARDDLDALLRRIAHQAAARRAGGG